jgi:hypothetical protein
LHSKHLSEISWTPERESEIESGKGRDMVETIPNSLQQLPILWILLYLSYVSGGNLIEDEKSQERKRRERENTQFYVREDKVEDVWFTHIVRMNLLIITMLYSLAVYVELVVLSSGGEDTDDTKKWMQEHDDLFWFMLGLHQSYFMGLIGMEILGKKKMKRIIFLGVTPPLIQWIVGLFASDPLAAPVVGLVFEMLIPMSAIIYAFKIYGSKNKMRSLFGLLAVSNFILSMIPVFFLAKDMKSANHAVFFTTIFGMISFFFFAKLSKRTKIQCKPVLEFNLQDINNNAEDSPTHTLE